ncbi:MAG: Fe-S protein assembly chaperone HscA [Myxococcales bacterium]|nr:Fe-S protein assembly chaperone HscA [Myxococcales bacterium]
MSTQGPSIHDTGALFQIAEPEERRAPARAPGRGIGIDLGTTNSLVALAPHGDDPKVLADGEGRALLPSVVSYVGDRVIVGDAAQAQQEEAPGQVVSSVKRFMGRGLSDVDFTHPYHLVAPSQGAGVLRLDVGAEGEPHLVTPVEVSAEILRVLRLRAEDALGGPIDGAVITVPAYFDDAQRQATRDAGRIAGLNVYRLLAEPTAAALAYGLDRGGQGLFAVYDLGGGTFDVSVLRLHDGVFQVLATGGDSALGGDDLDRALAAHLLGRAGFDETRPPTRHQRELARIAARAAKEALSEQGEVRVSVAACGIDDLAVTRATFEELIEPLVQRTIRACRAALRDAGVRARELDGVVLVGGSTRVPRVRAAVEETFGRPPLTDIDPDKVVAYGAAIQADILSGSAREGVTLLDVVPLSLGIETMGGIVEKLIPRNATIPIAARQVFTNYSEQQTGMQIHVVQGERELASDCRSLARFELRGIPRLPPSMARVEITFQLDADALLTVTARELMTGVRQSVEVKPTYGLSEEEVDRLVMESYDHASDDYAARNLAEARVELGRVALAVRTALAEVGHLTAILPAEERASIEAALVSADALMREASEAEAVNAARVEIERRSEPFARRRMERALLAGMEGKSLHEIESVLAAEEEHLDERRGGHSAEVIDG